MNGIDATNGKWLSGIEHLKQSIADILTTPIGSRVMRHDYGSRLYELVDNPTNASTITDIYAATAEALARWEPRFKLLQVTSSVDNGKVLLDLRGAYLPNGEEITLEGVVLA